MKILTLNLQKLISKSILSRDVIRNILEQEISKMDADTIDLDFSGIEFISRSAAHEILKMKAEFEYNYTNKKEIILKNLNNDVAQMVRLVAANRAYSPKREEDFKPKRMTLEELVKM